MGNQNSKTTPTSEQDTLGSKFGLSDSTIQKSKDQAKEVGSRMTSEQDTYASKFGVSDSTIQNAKQQIKEIGSTATSEQDTYASRFGLSDSTIQKSKQEVKDFSSKFSPQGAEQDTYASRFGLSDSTVETSKQQAKDFYASHLKLPQGAILGADGRRLTSLANKQGVGAEQDRYNAHFGLDAGKVKKVTDAMFHNVSGAEQDRYAGWFGLGSDGLERMRLWREGKAPGGVRAEQDVLAGHFSEFGERARQKIAEAVDKW